MLNRNEIAALIKEKKLIEGCVDADTQTTPNGFDLTVGAVYSFEGAGALDFSNKERVLPACTELAPQKLKPGDTYGWWQLAQGVYKVRTNETVNLPNDLIAIAFPRSSLLRMGAFTHNGVWDAGFQGRGEFILAVNNPHGMRMKQNARITQLIFLPISKTAEGYNGMYKHL